MQEMKQIFLHPRFPVRCICVTAIVFAATFSVFYPIPAIVSSISLVILFILFLKPELSLYLLLILLHLLYIYFTYTTPDRTCILMLFEVYVVMVFSMWCFSRMANLIRPYPGTSCDLTLMVLAGLSLVSLLWSHDQVNGVIQLFRLFIALSTFVLIVSIVSHHRILNTIIWLVILMGVLNSILCFISIHTFPDYQRAALFHYGHNFDLSIRFNVEEVGNRGHGLSHPLTTAYWLNIALIFSFGKFMTIKGKRKFILGLFMLFMLTAHLTTLAKMPLLALIAGILFLFYFLRPIKRKILMAIVILFVCIGLSFALVHLTKIKDPLSFITRQLTTSIGDTSVSYRLLWWLPVISKSLENYGMGVGIGGALKYLGGPFIVQHPHSIYVSVLGELGMMGFILLLIILYLALMTYFKALKECKSEYYRRILLTYIAGFIVVIINGFTDFDYLVNLLWWYIGLGFALVKLARESPYGDREESLPFFKDKQSICCAGN